MKKNMHLLKNDNFMMYLICKKYLLIIFLIFSIMVLADINSIYAATKESDTTQTINGKVSSVTMSRIIKGVAGQRLDDVLSKNPFDLSSDSKETVNIILEGKPDEIFAISVPDIMTMERFKDLDGCHSILSPLQKRLIGKNVVLQYEKSPKKQPHGFIYKIINLKIAE